MVNIGKYKLKKCCFKNYWLCKVNIEKIIRLIKAKIKKCDNTATKDKRIIWNCTIKRLLSYMWSGKIWLEGAVAI